MRHFKYVLEYLHVAIKEGATYTAQEYVAELDMIHDAHIKRSDEHIATISARDAEIARQLVIMQAQRERLVERRDQINKQAAEALCKKKIIEEHVVQLGKLKSEVEQARADLRTAQEAHLKRRDELEAMREQRIKEKQALFHERYSAEPTATGDVIYKDIKLMWDEVSNPLWGNTQRPRKYEKPNTKTPDHTWRANPDKKWETSYTKRVVDGLRDMRERIVGIRDLRTDESRLFQAAELLTDYHSTMHDVYEERDAAQKGVKQARAEFDLVVNHRDWLQTELDAAKTGRASAIHEHTIALNANNALLVRVNSLVEERDFAKKQHEAALASFGPLNKRISDLIKERDAASATVKARIREAVGL